MQEITHLWSQRRRYGTLYLMPVQSTPKDTFLSDCSRCLVKCLCSFIDILFNLFIYLLYIFTFIQLK